VLCPSILDHLSIRMSCSIDFVAVRQRLCLEDHASSVSRTIGPYIDAARDLLHIGLAGCPKNVVKGGHDIVVAAVPLMAQGLLFFFRGVRTTRSIGGKIQEVMGQGTRTAPWPHFLTMATGN